MNEAVGSYKAQNTSGEDTTPAAGDAYPAAWTPRHVRQMRAVSDSVEQYVAALNDDEFAELAARTRPAGGR